MTVNLDDLSEPLLSLIQTIRFDEIRSDLVWEQIPSPKGLAPQSLALSINVGHDIDAADHGISRLVFAYDPEIPEGWNSEVRIIGYAKSPIELEMARDEYLAALPWEWLRDALIANGALYSHDAGTSTTVISTGHGSLIGQPQHAELELRASWAPRGEELNSHVSAWCEMLALISGLPPSDSSVKPLRTR